jgi:hypothetical protein
VADLEYYVHWSRPLLATIRWRTGCELLIGASAVTYNPHFLYFSSPRPLDEHLGVQGSVGSCSPNHECMETKSENPLVLNWKSHTIPSFTVIGHTELERKNGDAAARKIRAKEGVLSGAVAWAYFVSPQDEARYAARPASQSKHPWAGSGGLQVTTVDRPSWAADQVGPDDSGRVISPAPEWDAETDVGT